MHTHSFLISQVGAAGLRGGGRHVSGDTESSTRSVEVAVSWGEMMGAVSGAAGMGGRGRTREVKQWDLGGCQRGMASSFLGVSAFETGFQGCIGVFPMGRAGQGEAFCPERAVLGRQGR